jgi:hypothetical protein
MEEGRKVQSRIVETTGEAQLAREYAFVIHESENDILK